MRKSPVLCALLVSLSLVSASPPNPQASSLHLGIPGYATADPANPAYRTNYLSIKPTFTLSYNDTTGTPNWVSWRLTLADIGHFPRLARFATDTTLPVGFRRITDADYAGSGFDRGHICPHGDRNATVELNRSTFVMSNVVPQSAQSNQKAWGAFEAYLRELVTKQGKVCYIVAGPDGRGGVSEHGFRSRIAGGRVVVPCRTWKVVMVLDRDVVDPAVEIDETTAVRLIAVIVPNDDRVGEDWAGYRVSVHEVEELTGYTFFDRVPVGVLEGRKREVDAVPVVSAPVPVVPPRPQLPVPWPDLPASVWVAGVAASPSSP